MSARENTRPNRKSHLNTLMYTIICTNSSMNTHTQTLPLAQDTDSHHSNPQLTCTAIGTQVVTHLDKQGKFLRCGKTRQSLQKVTYLQTQVDTYSFVHSSLCSRTPREQLRHIHSCARTRTRHTHPQPCWAMCMLMCPAQLSPTHSPPTRAGQPAHLLWLLGPQAHPAPETCSPARRRWQSQPGCW